jgi:hypothetical protein
MAQQSPQRPPSPEDLASSGLSTRRAGAVAGLAFAVLFMASLLILRAFVEPSSSGLLGAINAIAGDHVNIVPGYLIPFAGIAFLWFIAVVRDRIGVFEDRFFSTVFLGSGFVFVSMLFAAASVVAGLLTLTEPTAAATELGQSIARGMFYIYGARSAGVFTIVASMIVLRTGALYRWAALVGVVIGLMLLLTAGHLDWVILLFPAWVALISVLVLVAQVGSKGKEAGS